MITTSVGSMWSHRATDATVWTALCVEQCRNSFPFCQYAIALRGSSVEWLLLDVEKVSSSTSAAFLKLPSTSPYDHSSAGFPMGSLPWSYSAKSCSVHLSRVMSGGP